MQIFTKRLGVLAGFAIMLFVMAANTALLRRQLATQVQNQGWVAHTRQVMLELAETESLLKDAERGQRGYLYTDDPKYLAPYQAAAAQISQHLDALQQLTMDNPAEQARVASLRDLTQRKLDELARTVELNRLGDTAEARAIVASDTGLLLMQDIHTTFREMDREEESLDAARQATYRASVLTTVRSIYLTTALAIFGLAGLAYFILREIDLRERHSLQLLQREEWFRVTLTSLGDAVIATDQRGCVSYLNPLAEKLIGMTLDQALDRAIEEVFPIFNEDTGVAAENPVAKVMEFGAIVGLANHTVLRHPSGAMIPIEDSAAPIRDSKDRLIGVVLVFRDATRERKTQEALRQSEKLTAAARMAATVAHEINNPLEAIGNLIFIAKGTPGTPAIAIEYLDLAEQELDRVSHIAKQTLGFYREFRVPERIDMPTLVDSVLKLTSSKLQAKGISIAREFAPCQPVKGLPGELKQAISNLVSNAAEAVERNGAIRVQLGSIEAADGTFVQIRVEDSGPGIAPELRGRIFEPFFTTKDDVGTGLGLWVTKEIIDRHKGTLEILSAGSDGLGGAVFNILLPCDIPEANGNHTAQGHA
jgi:PAS domain S-box-containing protein